MSSVRIFSVDVAAVHRAMDEYARALLAKHPEVEEVIVFGSFADEPTHQEAILMFLSYCEKRAIPHANGSRDSCLTNRSMCPWMFSLLRALKWKSGVTRLCC